MPSRHYLDVETVPNPEYWDPHNPNNKSTIAEPDKTKIISIQYQAVEYDTGKPTDDLTILREWDSSEKEIVQQFAEIFVPDTGSPYDKWRFIPIGNNLNFEMLHLIPKLKLYCNIDLDPFQKPLIDIKHTLITVNGGKFTGYSEVLGKTGKASSMASWYYSQNYNAILDYIIEEAESFLDVYQILCLNLPALKEYLKDHSYRLTELKDLK